MSATEALIPELWSDEVIKTYSDSLAMAGKTLVDKIDEAIFKEAIAGEAKLMEEAKIGDKVGLMNTQAPRLNGLEWFYVGDNYQNDAVVMAHNGEYLYEEHSKLYVTQAECYHDCASLRLDYMKMDSSQGAKNLKPLKYESGEIVEVNDVVRSSVFYGSAILKPGHHVHFS